MVEKLARQVYLRGVVLGDHQQPRCVLVDPVYQQPHPFVPVGVGGAPEIPCEGIDKGTGVIAMARVYHQARGLVDDHEVVVLVNYVERDWLRFYLYAPSLVRHHQGDDVEGFHLVVRLDHPVVDADILRVYGQLDTVARSVLQMVGQILVDAQQSLSAVDDHAEMFIHFLLLIVFEQDVSVFHVAHRAAILDWLVVSLRWMVVPMAAGAPTW